MPFPTQFTVISPTTNQTAQSGVIDMGAIANRWSLQLEISGQIGRPTVNVLASCDGVNFAQVEPTPQPQFGRWLGYGTPARYIQVSLGGNNGTAAVYVVAQSD